MLKRRVTKRAWRRQPLSVEAFPFQEACGKAIIFCTSYQAPDSAAIQLSRLYSRWMHKQRTHIRGKENQFMKRPGMRRHLLRLVGFMVFLATCASPPAQSSQIAPSPTVQSAQASPSPSQPAKQLKPNAPIPTSFPATRVNIGGLFRTDSPWLQARPTSSGIVAYLAYSGVSPSGTYRLSHTHGFFPEEGLYTKTLWAIDHQEAAPTLLIDGIDLGHVTKTFHDTGNAMSGPGLPTGIYMHTYTSYLQAPSVGCWRLQITSGQASGTIIMWFIG